MEVKSKRIKLSKADDYIALQESFGWKLVSKDDPRPDETIIVTLERDKDDFSDYAAIKELESDYNKINRPIPIATIVFALLGAILIIMYFLFKGSIAGISCIYAGLTSLLFMLFTAIVFLIVFIKRKKLLKNINNNAARKSGANKDWPTPRNILEEDEYTWTIRSQIE